jgi:hypothetical protein
MPLNLNSVYPAMDPEFMPFPSRRSVVHSTQGMIACTQPLAARCGLKVLDAGGNAAVSNCQPHFQSHTLTTYRMQPWPLVGPEYMSNPHI